MTRKMIVRRIGVAGLGLFVLGCRKEYVAAGMRGDFDLSGSYDVRAHATTNGCPDVPGDQGRSRLDVQHARGEMQLTVIFEGDPYPAEVQRNGQFRSEAMERRRGGAVERATLNGRFRDSTISASLEVRRGTVAPVLPTTMARAPRPCNYHVSISGMRIAEPRQ